MFVTLPGHRKQRELKVQQLQLLDIVVLWKYFHADDDANPLVQNYIFLKNIVFLSHYTTRTGGCGGCGGHDDDGWTVAAEWWTSQRCALYRGRNRTTICMMMMM